MNALRIQYFLSIAVVGALAPYQSVYLRERGMSDAQIGWVQSMTGIGVLLMPALMTLIADLKIANRRLIGALLAGCAGAAALMAGAESFVLLAVAFALSSTCFAPMRNLIDGLVFGEQARRAAAGMTHTPYHRIRVYGTVGFIAPAFVLYWLMRDGTLSARVAIVAAVVIALAAMINTLALPDTIRPASDGARRLPTVAALRAMLEPHLAVYVICMWLFAASTAGFFAFYPIYLTETLGLGKQWVGLIVCVGVAVEVVCTLGFAWLLRALGLKGLILLGFVAGVVRLALLWAVPNVAVAVGVQALHGLTALITQTATPVYLNQRADPAYRNSIQGTYVMIVEGTGRMAGFAAAGYIATGSVANVFGAGALACVVCVALFGYAFRDVHADTVKP